MWSDEVRLDFKVDIWELCLIEGLRELNEVGEGELYWDKYIIIGGEIWGILGLEFKERFDDGWFLLFGLYKIFLGDVGFVLLVGVCWGVGGVFVVWDFRVIFWFLFLVFIEKWDKFWRVFLILLIDFDLVIIDFIVVFKLDFFFDKVEYEFKVVIIWDIWGLGRLIVMCWIFEDEDLGIGLV